MCFYFYDCVCALIGVCTHTRARVCVCEPVPLTGAVRTAGVLRPDWVLAQQGRAHLGLTQHPPTVAGALRARVDVPGLALHEVLPPGRQAHRRVAQNRLVGARLVCRNQRKKREREREKRYEEPLKTVEGKQSVQIQTGQSCLANLGQFAAGEKCRTPQVVYNTENI